MLYTHARTKNASVTSAKAGRIVAATTIAPAAATCAATNANRLDLRPVETGASTRRALSESPSTSYTSLIASAAKQMRGPQTKRSADSVNSAEAHSELVRPQKA